MKNKFPGANMLFAFKIIPYLQAVMLGSDISLAI